MNTRGRVSVAERCRDDAPYSLGNVHSCMLGYALATIYVLSIRTVGQ